MTELEQTEKVLAGNKGKEYLELLQKQLKENGLECIEVVPYQFPNRLKFTKRDKLMENSDWPVIDCDIVKITPEEITTVDISNGFEEVKTKINEYLEKADIEVFIPQHDMDNLEQELTIVFYHQTYKFANPVFVSETSKGKVYTNKAFLLSGIMLVDNLDGTAGLAFYPENMLLVKE